MTDESAAPASAPAVDCRDGANDPAPMTDAEVIGALEESGAILTGHFVLTSGRHSNRYIQCARVLEDPALTVRLAREIVRRLGDRRAGIDLVAAPAVGGILIGFAVAQALGKRFIFSERQQGAMTLRRGFDVSPKARVLVVEDVVTTGGSVGELIDLGVKAGVVEKSGAWFSYDSQRIGQGRENAKQFLKDNPDMAAKIEAQVRQNSGPIAEAIAAGEPADKEDDDEAAEA